MQQGGDKEILRQRCEGTIIDLFDEFETKVMKKYPFHRQTLIKQKEADQQCEDNLPPGVFDVDSDHSENGPIPNAREIQSEYWKLKQFSLFISMWRYLLSSAWLNRTSVLQKGDAVTVEPEGESVAGSLTPHVNSPSMLRLRAVWARPMFTWCATDSQLPTRSHASPASTSVACSVVDLTRP